MKRAGDVAGEVEGAALVGGGLRFRDGPLGSGDAAAGDGGDGVEVGARGDAEFEEALDGAEVEERGAESAAGETQADAAVSGLSVLLPWNWFRGAFAKNAMISKFETAFGKGTLNLLPEHPRFVFCATDMAFGASFIFERDRVGSYLAGYAPPDGFTLAQAVAASACFPPLFGPLRIDRAAERFKGGRAPGVSADTRRQILEDLRVTDGGVYDASASSAQATWGWNPCGRATAWWSCQTRAA